MLQCPSGPHQPGGGSRGVAGVPAQPGAALYLVGAVGVTVAANVPPNNRLERDPDSWPAYRRTWTRWDTLRALAAAVTIAPG